MNSHAKALALKKNKETGHEADEWLKALESALTSLKSSEIDQASLEYFIKASSSPAKFTTVARLIYQHGKSQSGGEQISKIVLARVNASPFDLTDWIDAVAYFYEWLVKNNRKINFLSMIKYLECCAEAPDAKEQGQTLSGLLENMLDACGYEAG